jgi:acyl-CoA-dependent ceramide synthase
MTEPFPPLHGATPPSTGGNIARRRRKSSGLGADLPGDVDVPSFGTSRRLDAVNMKSPVEAVCRPPRSNSSSTTTTTMASKEAEAEDCETVHVHV